MPLFYGLKTLIFLEFDPLDSLPQRKSVPYQFQIHSEILYLPRIT